ncbi:BA14K family protein [Mesorhizobium sp. KR9-304]|uniref:BA14K family protein n=1 Tax=Mesorhizobium sp. KR9-304 TaxID=3156614 RepID=UPI0032B47038
MWRSVLVAVSAAMVIAPSSARAGGWEYDPAADLILYDSVPVASWYRQEPWTGTATGHYYSYYPNHVPGYPHRLTGYPVPIYKAPARVPRAVVRAPASHVDWCAQRYRSYDVRTDTFQPYHGSRRICRSPFH